MRLTEITSASTLLMADCSVINTDSILPLTPFGALLVDAPAPNSYEADYTEYKDIKSLVARDPNIAATITSISLGMVMAGVVNDGKPKARDILIAVKQIDNDIRRHQEEISHKKKQEGQTLQMACERVLQKEVKETQENKKGLFDDLADGGKSPFANLVAVMAEEKPEQCEMTFLPRFAWMEVSGDALGTGTPSPNIAVGRFKKEDFVLAA